MKDSIKEILYKAGRFFGLFAYVVGAIGGFGYACYCKAYVIAVCIILLAVMAFPTAKKWFKELIG